MHGEGFAEADTVAKRDILHRAVDKAHGHSALEAVALYALERERDDLRRQENGHGVPKPGKAREDRINTERISALTQYRKRRTEPRSHLER